MLAVLRALLLLALAPLAAQGIAQAAPPALPTLAIEPAPTARAVVWDGVVEAVESTTIAAQTNAKVLALPLDVGDAFTQGTVLLRLSDAEQQAELRAAQARLAAARAESNEADPSWRRAAALFKAQASSQAQLEAATARRDASRGALNAAQALVRGAEQQVHHTVITAPFDGVVLRRFVQVGQAVQSGPPQPQPLLSIASLRALRVDVIVPETVAAAIRTTPQATIRLPSSHEVAGSHVTVFPYADQTTHTVHVRVALPGEVAGLYPGMTVPVAFPGRSAARLLVPTGAIVMRGELTGVYVLAPDDSVSLRQVRLGHEAGDRTEILAGLQAGEKVVTDPTAAAQYLAARHAAGGSRP